MTALTTTPFQFESKAIRTVIENGEPLFVAIDVAAALGYRRPKNAVARHCKGALKRGPLQTEGGAQDFRLIHEPDVYRLIVGSHLPAAQRFERWLFEDVLPTIRKTGTYASPNAEPPQPRPVTVLADFDGQNGAPVVVPTLYGNAYVNRATYHFHAMALVRRGSPIHRELMAALAASCDVLVDDLPQPYRAACKLKQAVLKANPLWADIMRCLRSGWSRVTIARICGCSLSTLKRHLKKMDEAGLFEDPLAGLDTRGHRLFPDAGGGADDKPSPMAVLLGRE